MNKQLTLGSLFDGSGGFPLAGLLSGVTPVWASEIEPFPIRVTTKRLPFMKHYGDISQMDGGKIEPVDIVTFGSPCTNLSVAGRREGLEGKQSSLFFQAVRIINEMRCATNGKYPRWICWENVPGAFSSNSGYDFQAVLDSIIRIEEPEAPPVPVPDKDGWPTADCYMGDGWSVAYRVLDAQHWGLPQRRKRIFLIGDLAGQCAGDVLFKSEGLSRYSAESFRAWQRAAGGVENCTGTAGFGLDGYNGTIAPTASTLGVNCGMSTGRNGVVLNDQGGNRMDITHDVTCTLRAEAHHPPVVMEPAAVPLDNHPADSRVDIAGDGKVQTLTSRMGTGGGNVPMVMNCTTVFGICSYDSNAMKSDNPHSGFYEATTTRTLDANGGNPSCNQGGVAVVCVDQGGGKSYCNVAEDLSPTLSCTHGGEPAVCVQGKTFAIEGNGSRPSHKGDGYSETDVMYTLNTVDRHAVYTMTTGSFSQVAEGKAPTILARDYKDPTAVCYGIGRDAFNQGKNAKFAPSIESELQPTLVAKGPGAVQSGYAVRRLTPTECARLQGFPDWWCADLGIEPTTDDLRYWYGVFETHRKIAGTSAKPKTLKQIAKWLRDPYSDAAEYKMWGNGVALPCVYFVLAGIVFYSQ